MCEMGVGDSMGKMAARDIPDPEPQIKGLDVVLYVLHGFSAHC